MEDTRAKQIISEALNIAISKGCFNLIEVTNIVKAIETINQQPNFEFGEVNEE
jgi:hypothetical protein